MSSPTVLPKYVFSREKCAQSVLETMCKKGQLSDTDPLFDMVTRQPVSFNDFPAYYATLYKRYQCHGSVRRTLPSIPTIVAAMRKNMDDPDLEDFLPGRPKDNFWTWIRTQRESFHTTTTSLTSLTVSSSTSDTNAEM